MHENKYTTPCNNVDVAAVAEDRNDISKVVNFLSDKLPFHCLEVVGDLQNYLRTQGAEAFSSIKYHPVMKRNIHNQPVFSDTVTFEIGIDKYEFHSSGIFMRKSDAKKNAAYKACKALNLYNDNNQEIQVESAIVPTHILNSTPVKLKSEDPPCGSMIAPETLNVIGEVNEHLQKLGALDTLKASDDVGHEYFLYVLSFKIKGREYRFESSKEYPNKKDAKRSAFFNAYMGLGLHKLNDE
jgi:hypothetical protein